MPNSKQTHFHKNRSLSLILVSFLLIIFAVLLLWAIRGNDPQEISIIEGRLLARFTTAGLDLRRIAGRLYRGNFDTAMQAFENLIHNRSDQRLFEKAASDQFPFRIALIRVSKAVDRLFIATAYAFLPDPAIPADMRSDLFVMRDRTVIIPGPMIYTEAMPNEIDDQIQNYQLMINAHPGVNFLAYRVDLLPYAPYHPLAPYFPDADGGRSLAYFEEHKPDGLAFAKMDLGSFEGYLQNFFRTDVHWNIRGILKGYAEVYQLLAQSYPTISPPLQFDPVVTFPGIEFMGSTRKTFYPLSGDEFEGIDFNLPEHKIYVNGEEVQYDRSKVYFDGQYATQPYYYHFTEFFGENIAYLEYEFDNGSGRDLLMVGDSFKIPLQPLVAYHYQHTYVVNPSLYKNFDLSDFLEHYPVDDILFIGGNNVLFIDEQWMIDL
jgi:hypothetical protein